MFVSVGSAKGNAGIPHAGEGIAQYFLTNRPLEIQLGTAFNARTTTLQNFAVVPGRAGI
jgi:hypothetical protein